MQSLMYHYWISQCQKGYKIHEDDDNYEYLADKTLHIEKNLWVYRVDDIIYACIQGATELEDEYYIIN